MIWLPSQGTELIQLPSQVTVPTEDDNIMFFKKSKLRKEFLRIFQPSACIEKSAHMSFILREIGQKQLPTKETITY